MIVKAWITAFRLRTLPLALASIGMGTFLAAKDNYFDGFVLLLCVCTTIFLQILSNLANDYGDSQHGADHDQREGPKRAVQSGLISKEAMKTALVVFTLLSLGSGIFLLRTVFADNLEATAIFLGLGTLAILAAIFYTMGKKPYGYSGLGDFSVLIFFGLVGVLGSHFLFAKEFVWLNIFPALSCGLFSVAVLNINNIRDMRSDALAGKNSFALKLGESNSRKYHWFLIIAGILCAMIYTVVNFHSMLQLLFLISIPFLFFNAQKVSKRYRAVELDPLLKQMALSTLIFVITFGIGLLLSW